MSATANCMRCHVRCRTGQGDPRARLLRIAEGPIGYCLNCAVTEWFLSVEPLCDIIKRDGIEGLKLPHVQQQFAAVMRAGFAQATPDQIDWLEVVANWDLPFPKKKSRKSKK